MNQSFEMLDALVDEVKLLRDRIKSFASNPDTAAASKAMLEASDDRLLDTFSKEQVKALFL